MKKLFILYIMLSLTLISCKDTSTNGDPTKETSIPVIQSLSSDKQQVVAGGSDLATLTCVATGGNLTYKWEVDLGDIIPIKSDKSIVTFSGASCCVGDKIIKCTVSNSLGSVTKELKLYILEEIKTPEILDIESNKEQVSISSKESLNLVCFALGGSLSYRWETDCGDILVNPTDNSKINYTPKENCKGTKSIKCSVTNVKGSVSQTKVITVID